MDDGHRVFSPITHSHPISKHTNVNPCDHEFWMRQDLWILAVCDVLYVLCVEGWEKSSGVQKEIEIATKLGMNIVYVEVNMCHI